MKLCLNNKVKLFIMMTILVTAIAGMVIFFNHDAPRRAFLRQYGLNGLSVEEIVNKLDRETGEPVAFKASLTGGKLILKDEANAFSFKMPANRFYLSLAPYVEETHPCSNHNLVTCRGELVDETFYVIVTDYTGNRIVSEEMTSGANGFVGLWLPLNITGTVEIRYGGKTGQASFSTFSEDDTCLTTPLQLK